MKWLACVPAMSALSIGATGQQTEQGSEKPMDLTSISIEDLLNIQQNNAKATWEVSW
jgi:hypothetical protein